MTDNNNGEHLEPLPWLGAAVGAVREFNSATIGADLNAWAIHHALGLLGELAMRMPQAFEQLSAELRRVHNGQRFDTDDAVAEHITETLNVAAELAAAKHSAVKMHDAITIAQSDLGELILGTRPPLLPVDSSASAP
jgi:hypothetical protein